MEAKTIGIVGGGQLGRMLTLAAKPLGFKVLVVDPTPNCPATQVGAQEITANLYDKRALRQLVARSDYVTAEIEHLDSRSLANTNQARKKINPSPRIIRLIQDKLAQKKFLHQNRVPIAEFQRITSLRQANQLLGYYHKMLVKTRHGAYDGRGNMVVATSAELAEAIDRFANAELYAEKYVAFKKELAVMVARSKDGEVRAYPVVETIHRRNICVEVLAPASITKTEERRARNLALKIVSIFNGVGVFGIEMFLTKEGKVLVNEVAPRVHNSGHYTIEACRTSQFEQHIRAITGLPLGETRMVEPAAVMINILGERNAPATLKGLKDALAIPSIAVHIYGKSPTKLDRKMGHITATASNLATARRHARLARARVTI